MSEQLNAGTQPPRKGMSKGCLVALIIVGAIVLLVAVGVGYVCMNKEKVIIAGAKFLVSGMTSELKQSPVEGVDSDRFNRVCAAFLVRIDEPPQNLEDIALFAQTAGAVIQNRPYTAEQIERFVQAMITCYPELAEVAGPAIPTEAAPEPDTLTTDSTVSE